MGRPRPSRMAAAAIADLRNMEEGHDIVTATLAEMGICAAPMRTILIQNKYFVGHKYHFDGGYAIRRAGENAIEIYDDDGKLLKTVSLEETDKKGAA